MYQRIRSRTAATAGLMVLVLAMPGFAQTSPPGPAAMPGMPGMGRPSTEMPGMAMPASRTGTSLPANQQEMMRSMEKMNHDMMGAPMTGDPDRDLVTMMMPHHQGAIDMARIYLRDGKDPAIRKMAQRIIADQTREIRDFKAWLAKHPAPSR